MQRVFDLARAAAKRSGRRVRRYGSFRLYEMFIGRLAAPMMALLVWLHILAAVMWIGGMIFLSLVLAPLMRSHNSASEVIAFFRSAARRFRFVVWGAVALLLSTGPMLLRQRGLSVLDPSGWPHVLQMKLGLVGILLLLTVAHDFLHGSWANRIRTIPESARSSWEQMIIHTSSWVPRVALVVALLVLAAAVLLARS
jgi:putative copper resistance protein D